MNDVTRVEETTARLAQGGRAAFVARPTRLHAVDTAAEVWGFTQSAWQRGNEADKYINTDKPLLAEADVPEHPGASDVVMRVLGLNPENLTIDVTRTPVSPGDRLILGNAGIGRFIADEDPSWCSGGASSVVDRYVPASVARSPHLPPTMLVADLR